jgi:3-deoxy-D-manno-octulosonic-acid transferase
MAYGLATGLAAPLARPLLEARARRGKEDRNRLGERLGRPSALRPPGALAWLHGASVGESLSLLPLIDGMAARRPDLAFLVTSGTRASAEVLAKRLPKGAIHQFAPVDAPGAVARFLGHWRPQAGLFVESELWPNLILKARADGVRLALVSARMTAKSAQAWAWRAGAARALLSSFELILAQDDEVQRRLEGLGAQVNGQLNLKRVGAPLGADARELAALQGAVAGRPTIVALSTHPGEEALIEAAVRALGGRALAIVIPRHPDRAAEIAAALAGRRIARRSAGETITDETDVYLADTLGEVGLFLRPADVVVMGGGFAPGVGGHNPLEPARLGKPVITGPGVANFKDIYAEMIASGAAQAADGQTDLTAALKALLDDPAQRAKAGAAALAYVAAQSDQLTKALDLIEDLLPVA